MFLSRRHNYFFSCTRPRKETPYRDKAQHHAEAIRQLLYRPSSARQPSRNTRRIITWDDVSSMTSPGAIKDRSRRLQMEYEDKEQFTWMLARETLERDRAESRWCPILHSDSSISRPAPLISASSSTTVLHDIRNIDERIPNRSDRTIRESIGRRSSPLANLLKDWDGIRLGGTLQR